MCVVCVVIVVYMVYGVCTCVCMWCVHACVCECVCVYVSRRSRRGKRKQVGIAHAANFLSAVLKPPSHLVKTDKKLFVAAVGLVTGEEAVIPWGPVCF